MKVLLCNKYFFLNGGVEKYLYDVMNRLDALGHTPVPFSVKYADSWKSPYSTYFLDPPGDPAQAHHRNIRLTPSNWIRLLDRSIYSFEARRALARLIGAIDGASIAYMLNIYNYMSPSILHTFRKHKIPVAMQIGDYNLLCPNYVFLRKGSPCTLCMNGSYYHGLRYCCVKKSYAASAVRVASMYIQKWLRLYRLVDAFVVPCEFMKSKLIEGGFPARRIHLLQYPVVKQKEIGPVEKKNYILFFGRITFEKGLDTLIRAYQKMNPPVDLILAGRDYDGETARLKKLIRPEYARKIRFVGFQTGGDLSRLISEALLSVVPSRWYDNAPISVYDSFLHETAVLAARIGGIPEQIREEETGRLFSPDSEEELKEALAWMLSDRERLIAMGKAGREYVKRELTVEQHVDGLLDLFDKIIHSYHNRSTPT